MSYISDRYDAEDDPGYDERMAEAKDLADEEREPRVCHACKRGWHPECFGCECECNRDEPEECPTCVGTGGGVFNDCRTCDGNGVI